MKKPPREAAPRLMPETVLRRVLSADDGHRLTASFTTAASRVAEVKSAAAAGAAPLDHLD